MSSACERGREPHRDHLVGEAEAHDAAAHREDVGVVVLAGHAGRVEVIAERRAHPWDLVGGHLFALTAAADDDAAVGPPFGDEPPDLGADFRVVNGVLGVRSAVVDLVAETAERGDEVLLQRKPGVIGANRNTHA